MVQHKVSYIYDVILSLTNNKLDIFVFIKIDRIEITFDSGSVIPAGQKKQHHMSFNEIDHSSCLTCCLANQDGSSW